MSRWIDADEFLENNKGFADREFEHPMYQATLRELIDEAPSIDIVRCSECVYCNVQNTKYLYAICERHGIEFKPFEDDTRTHGCAWGSEKPNNSERSE